MDANNPSLSSDLLLGLLGAALVGLLALALYRRLKAPARRKQPLPVEPPRLPEGAVYVRDRSAAPRKTDRSGRMLLVLVGTFAATLGSGVLTLIERCGLESCIGSILLLELDRARLERFLTCVPSVFLDRIVAVGVSGLPGGLGNRGVDEAMHYVPRWGPPVINGANQVVELHQRLQRGEDAALVLVLVSLGGQAIIGVKAVETISRLFPMAQFYGFTALPIDDRLRLQSEGVLEEYRQAGVRGFVVSDNLGDDVRNDFGMIATVAGFAVAAEDSDASVEQNNAWYLLFRQSPGGLVSYSTYARTIPAYAHSPGLDLASRHYVFKSSVVNTIQTALEEVNRPENHALAGRGLDGSEPLTSRFKLVLAAIRPDDLKENEDDIFLGGSLSGQSKRNFHLLFAPITAEIDPERPLCPVAVVSLHAVHQPTETLRALTELAKPQLPAQAANGQTGGQPTFNKGA